jgi:hypothetical protein
MAAVLRDVADDVQEREAIANAVYINPNPFKNQNEAVRVLAHTQDRDFFRKSIQLPKATIESKLTPQSDAQRLMVNNAEFLRDEISKIGKDERQRLVTFLLNQCMMVIVETSSRDSALRIFRVLNSRGLDLSNADVIKAELLEKFNEIELTKQASWWRALETELGREEFDNLLENIRFMWEKGKNRRALSDAYSARFRALGSSAVQLFFDEELEPAHRWFTVILDGNCAEFSVNVRPRADEALAGLRLVPNRDWMPAALAAALRYGATNTLIPIWEALEGLAWTLQLARRYDTQRMNKYAEFIRALETGKEKALQALIPTRDESKEAMAALSGPLYDRFPTRVVRAMLERLDRLLAEQPVLWTGTKTVEHIFPQDPGPGSWKSFSDKEREEILHTLGNLVLLTSRKNSSASRLEFKEKCNVYFGLGNSTASRKIATYASVQELNQFQVWNYKNYAARHKKNVNVLAARWGLTKAAT